MKNITILLILLILSFQLQAQTKAKLKKEIKKQVENIRKGKPVKSISVFNNYIETMPNVLFKEIIKYETDTMPKVRNFVYKAINQIGNKTTDTILIQNVVTKLSIACSDNDVSLRYLAANYLKKYSKNYFNEDAKKQIANVLEKDYTFYKNVLQLVGYLDMKEKTQELQSILSDTTHNDIQIYWKTQTALARLGETESIDYCVNYAKSKDVNNLLVRFVFKDLAYIKQPETIEYLISELNNDKKNCRAANPNSSGKITCAYRVMEILAPAIKDFPYKAKYGTQLDVPSYKRALKDIRIWFEEHPDYKINTSVF